MISSKGLSAEDRDALIAFVKKAYPDRPNPEEYLDRTVFSLTPEARQHSLLIYSDGRIIGANMGLPASAIIGEEEYRILWSYDTLVLPDYRNSDAGTIIGAFWYQHRDIFGAGLSEISVKMQKVMKSKFIAYASAFVKPNIRSKYLLNFIRPVFSTDFAIEFPAVIEVGKNRFRRIESADAFTEHPDNYWNKGIIEFKRDRRFIAWRFFYKNSPYALYQLDGNKYRPVYFAARKTVWHNIPLIYIADYRFDLTDTEDFTLILKSAEKLCRISKCGGVYFRSSIKELNHILKQRGYIQKGKGAQIATRFKPAVKQDYPVFFTPADSDMDFKQD